MVSGHVPINVVKEMLEDRPEILGVTLPGMPSGLPGMGGAKQQPFTIYGVKDSEQPSVYAVE